MGFGESSVTQIDRLGPRVDVDLTAHALHAAEERAVRFGVEGGMQGCGLEPPPSLDSDRFIVRCEFDGIVKRVNSESLVVNVDGDLRTVRLGMPNGIDFKPLVSHQVRICHRLEVSPMRSTTIDLSIRNVYGDLLFWARDGALPHPQHSQGHTVRIAINQNERFLVIQGMAGPTLVPGAASAVVATGIGRYVVLGVRVQDAEAAFVLVRKYF